MKKSILLAVMIITSLTAWAQMPQPEILILPTQDSITVSFQFLTSVTDSDRLAYTKGFMEEMQKDFKKKGIPMTEICYKEYFKSSLVAVIKKQNSP